MMVVSGPQSYQESSLDPIWKKNMQEEFNSLQDNETWELVSFPSKRKVVQCKWVYNTKVVVYGSDIKYNAKFVSKGFSEFQGVDYTETFAPVAKNGLYQASFIHCCI